MSDNDPFAEPDDPDRTIIKPNPGGRRTPAGAPMGSPMGAPQQAPQNPFDAPPPQAQPSTASNPAFGMPQQGGQRITEENDQEPTVEQGMTGMNRLNSAAATLFSLVSRIRNRAQHRDPDKLRRSVVAEVRAFENRALQSGIDAQEVKIARYAICATLDDVVLNTPWGGQSIWAQQSMVGTFHRETVGGDRFYDLLARLEKEPGKNIDLLEFVYMCLSLGFEGRLRADVDPRGPERHLTIRAGLARIIRGQRGIVEKELSPNWEGVEKPHKVLSLWTPVWITSATVAVMLTIAFMSLSWMLNRTTDRVLGQLSVIDSGQVAELLRRAPPPPPPPPLNEQQVERVKGFLEAEIDDGLVEVFQTTTTVTVRVAGTAMFGSGSDRLDPNYDLPISRIANALSDEEGQIIIVGHSDNVPIRSSRFPSNMALSLARAESVMRTIAGQIKQPNRLKAEGRADKEPIVSNDTPEGRAKNRRIEILLMREDAI